MVESWKCIVVIVICLPAIAQGWLPSIPIPTIRQASPIRLSYGTATMLKATNDEEQIALNELHTLLRDAVQAEDYMEAGRISDLLARRMYSDYDTLSAEERKARRRRMSWTGLGGAPWLTDRLDTLNYTFPTSIQINAFEAVNAILNSTASDRGEESLEERVRNTGYDLGIVVSGTTGSGKTLSYAVPLLSTLSDSLFLRQRLRVSDEEAVGDTAGDLADRISVVTSPQVSSNRPNSKRPIATGASLATLGRSGTDVKSPLALVVVPTRELGVQTAMLLYQLVGGTIKTSQKSEPETETEESRARKRKEKKYKGPKGVRIGCVLDDEEASFGLKLQTDIAVITPQYLDKLIDDGDINPSKLRVIVVDEADLALEQTRPETLSKLFDDDQRETTRLTLLVGASVTEALGNLAVSSRIIPEGKSYIATAHRFAPLTKSETGFAELEQEARTAAASLKDLDVCLCPGLKHERVVIPNEESGLLALTRLLRNELQAYDMAASAANGARGKKPLQRPRVVVFFPDEENAKAAIVPLRDALWGDHKLCVLLPKTGVSPLTIMDQFKRNETTVMLSTPTSVRGLDFPALTHVYAMYLPIDDPREYLHLAGRVGRVGHVTEGRVISVLKENEANKLEDLARTLGFEFTDVPAPAANGVIRTKDGEIDESAVDIEALRRSFEDTFSLVELAEDSPVNEVIDAVASEDTVDDTDEDSFQ